MPCISSHWLKTMLDSPAECYRKHLDPMRPVQQPTAAMQFGMLIHCLTLTPLQFGEEFIIDTGNRRTKAGRAHHAALSETGLIVISPNDFERAQAIVAVLKADPDAGKLLKGGKKERTLIQPRKDGLLPLKARLDSYHEAKRQVVELKTTHSLSGIRTTMQRYRYPLSAAFYRELAKALTVVFIFVETREPYDVNVFEMSRLDLQEGREQWQSALKRFDECWLANQWPEAEPTPDMDDDLLMMNFMPPAAKNNPGRFDLPVGELAL